MELCVSVWIGACEGKGRCWWSMINLLVLLWNEGAAKQLIGRRGRESGRVIAYRVGSGRVSCKWWCISSLLGAEGRRRLLRRECPTRSRKRR